MKEIKHTVLDNNLPCLKRVFGEIDVLNREQRLREIFDNVENSWQRNLNRLSGKKIQYLLIAEAAPWSENGIPRYFYNKIESKYHQRIWRAFFPKTSIPIDNGSAYDMLAAKNFLLIDTIPFSMDYRKKRDRAGYHEIVANSIPWWSQKLNSNKISFAREIKVALAFKKNGHSVISATHGQLTLKDGQLIELNDKIIAADGSGYTNSETLRKIYCL